MADKFNTDERNAQILLALLKAHGIRKIIVSPGTTNIAIAGSVQYDPWFEVYSGVDERHSAYMAVGMAAESGEAVALSCTGATASRNYLPALTEAYYRKLPILAITSGPDHTHFGRLSPQLIDRHVGPVDVVNAYVRCPLVRTDEDAEFCEREMNRAILELSHHGGGPVHIDLETGTSVTFNARELPSCQRIVRISSFILQQAPLLSPDAQIALFVGSGRVPAVWDKFVQNRNVAVFSDCGSQYMGAKHLHASLACQQGGVKNCGEYEDLIPDLIIDVGGVSGDYPTQNFLKGKAPVWRVSPDGKVESRFGRLEYVFEVLADDFVNHYSLPENQGASSYFKVWTTLDSRIREALPELPFSNLWMAQNLSPRIPVASVLHLGILNSLRSWNVFPPAERTVVTFSNVGGFGIDGNVSTLVGASLVSPSKLFFGVVGDLAFFYDLNAIGNRHVGKNLRLLLVNNGCGTEFNNYSHHGSQFGSCTNDFIAAGGHFGNKSKLLVRHYAEDLGFKYLTASSKEEFLEVMSLFVMRESDQPILFECFTTPYEESEALRMVNTVFLQEIPPSVRLKGFVPDRFKRAIRELVRP